MSELTAGEETPAESIQAGGLAEVMTQVQGCLTELGSDYSGSCEKLKDLQQRLSEGRFHLAVLGQFKRGKSTLLNALLGEDLLPTDILPVTAIPTFIRYGRDINVRICFDDKEEKKYTADSDRPVTDILMDYVTEAGNPHNQRQVSHVEISHPADLLQQGVVLIDTPGIGSTLKHNTEVAHQILPQCDAALFLVSPDPPITEMELDYLVQIRKQLPRTFYLLNKVDFLDEKELLASVKFLGEQLTPLCAGSPQIMPISARKGLTARISGDSDGWKESGMQQVEQNLIDFFAREKQQTLQLAVTSRTSDLLNDTIMQLQLSLSALQLPAAELQQRLEQFRQSLPAIEREQAAAADVLAGDLKRAITLLGEETDKVRTQVRLQITAQVERYLESVEDPEEMERLVRQTIGEETTQFFAPAMRTTAEILRREATDLLSLNQQRSNQLIEQVRQTAAEIFSIPYHAPVAEASYATFTAPAWSSELFISDMDPLGQKISRRLFSKKLRRKRTVKRLREECRKLLNQNIEQINWTLRRSLDESFRQFGADLQEQLLKIIAATRQAMEVALEKSEFQSRETAAAETSLNQALETLERLRAQLDD